MFYFKGASNLKLPSTSLPSTSSRILQKHTQYLLTIVGATRPYSICISPHAVFVSVLPSYVYKLTLYLIEFYPIIPAHQDAASQRCTTWDVYCTITSFIEIRQRRQRPVIETSGESHQGCVSVYASICLRLRTRSWSTTIPIPPAVNNTENTSQFPQTLSRLRYLNVYDLQLSTTLSPHG